MLKATFSITFEIEVADKETIAKTYVNLSPVRIMEDELHNDIWVEHEAGIEIKNQQKSIKNPFLGLRYL